ncbi:hypothetical protein NOF55_18525 [Rhizobiaceae bacterium BDR2-2]|uniref:Uncharacterized protein n=1 Tax=Ectorhizobium quercum TaxID=2965071 RepID=A0AAE3N4J1_9HYPH|nr:hypothetical protein [Ectorhizobium quercum]
MQGVSAIRPAKPAHLRCCTLTFLHFRHKDRAHLRRGQGKPLDFRRSIMEPMSIRGPLTGPERRRFGIVDRCDKRPDQLGLTGAPVFHGGA